VKNKNREIGLLLRCKFSRKINKKPYFLQIRIEATYPGITGISDKPIRTPKSLIP